MLKILFPFTILTFFLFSCSPKMKDPVFNGITGFKVDKVGFPKSTVVVTLDFTNPNKFRGKLSAAEGDAYVDSMLLGHFLVDTTIDIPGDSRFSVPVKLKIDLAGLVSNLEKFESQGDVMVRLTGKGRAGRSGVFRNFNINYTGRQSLSSLIKM